ncbi:MAG: hypothetical protein IPH76_05055 [Xanthomonadales bacterium]|nr:hypothetical protein [Xanthomonadales bacterium]
MRLVPDGHAADQRQRQHLHVAIAKGAHREVVPGLVNRNHHQQDQRELHTEHHRANQHEQRVAGDEQ